MSSSTIRKNLFISHSCLQFITIVILSFVIFLSCNHVLATPEDEAIGRWAEKFGDELWELGKTMTKSPEIKSKYKEYNARVEKKDGESLINSIVKNVGRMLTRKMDAIKCMLSKAETDAETFEFNETQALIEYQYYSSKYSYFDGDRAAELLYKPELYEYMYLNMTLNPDTHFYNESVNTDYSAVHVPPNVFDRYPEVLKAIMWSEKLDEVFIQNYKSDPALSWQYMCSDTGILRHYPALQWNTQKTDVYDCRKRSWYIETATCSKDIVILLDTSGSMHGFRSHVAKFTISQILETFSNNDFFTIYNYSKTTDDIIPCFKDTLVQATPENKKVFMEAISKLKHQDAANLTVAYEKAFNVLKKYFIERKCNETKAGCNQAIMLVTDGVAGNTTEVFEKFNWNTGDNSTSKMRVRVFTYLLGKEITKVREIQWMACLNRGYYSHVQTLDEVHEEVLKYVDVIATPLVLQDIEHPPTWTHAFADRSYKKRKKGEDDDDGGDDEDDEIEEGHEPRLMISVGIPLFNRNWKKVNSSREIEVEQTSEETVVTTTDSESSSASENKRKRARLLGVAGTDIPVLDIDKLTLPYKLGVNGYSFVVSNNGYVLLHPDLRPLFVTENRKLLLTDNYNSVDLLEIEQYNNLDDGPDIPRQFHEIIMNIRSNMVNHLKGSIDDVPIKFHYDNMRRVSDEARDYFYAPLNNTPFSLGLVLPNGYGQTWIKVGEEVKKNIHMNIDILDYFRGENWKVHPQWVYCKYHYLEGHEFKTPEDELREFLRKLSDPSWEWSEQYESDSSSEIDDSAENEQLNCGRKTLDDDAYYCNKELVQLLIFDAKVTNSSYGVWNFSNRRERKLIEKYNATLRFVATMSGLTRWQFIYGEVEVEEDQEFGDYHKMAIDETWYRSAILQHAIDPDSFVYSVPHSMDPPESDEIKVTSSHAIFPRDGGLEAPGCVVGFQFSHALMQKSFEEITSKDDCNGCVKTCDQDDHDCYVIDNNAYILLSDDVNKTGDFFGHYEGAVMDAMVQHGIFKSRIVYDYQALCLVPQSLAGESACTLSNPIKWLSYTINWLITEVIWYFGRLQYWAQGIPAYDTEEFDYVDADEPAKVPIESSGPTEILGPPAKLPPKPQYVECDKQYKLYTLQQKLFIDKKNAMHAYITNFSRPFHVKRIPKTNLLLVVVKTLYSSDLSVTPTTLPQNVQYDIEYPCYKLNLSFLERRRLEECYTEHPLEEEFTYCGHAVSIRLNFIIIVLMSATTFITTIQFLQKFTISL